MNQTRRHFFKTVAATVVAAVAAPTVVAKTRPGLDKVPMCFHRGRLYFVGSCDAIQELTFSRQCDLSDWEGDCYEFKPFPTEADRLKYRADRGL